MLLNYFFNLVLFCKNIEQIVMKRILNSFDLSSYGSELTERCTLRLLLMCLEVKGEGGGGGARVWEVFLPGEKKTYLGEGFTW